MLSSTFETGLSIIYQVFKIKKHTTAKQAVGSINGIETQDNTETNKMTSKILQGLKVNNFLCFELATASRFAIDVCVICLHCRLLVGRTRNPKCLVDRSFSHAVRRVDHNLTAISPPPHRNRSVRLLRSGTVSPSSTT